jgi:hypothetical protein
MKIKPLKWAEQPADRRYGNVDWHAEHCGRWICKITHNKKYGYAAWWRVSYKDWNPDWKSGLEERHATLEEAMADVQSEWEKIVLEAIEI